MLYVWLLLGVTMLGLILLATGLILLIKVKNRIIGALVTATGLVLTVCPVAFLMFQVITSSTRG